MVNMDPNNAIRPDYALVEFQGERQQLIDEGLTEQQAIRSLTVLWTLSNNAEKERWATRQERLEEARRRTEEDEVQRQQDLKDEEEAARLEDRKKNKNKYAPIKRGKVPSDPTILPAQYATRKLKAGDYCELHYFTNRGLDDAKISASIAEPDAMVMLPAADGIHSWVPTAAVKDPKAAPVTKDESLTWEEFNEAAPCMILSMKMHDWPDDRVNMHIQFWMALQSHRWRHAPDVLKQKALLLYQSQQRCRWHLTVGTAQGWSLEEINQDLLFEVREELFNEKRDKDTIIAVKQAAAAYIASSSEALCPQHALTVQQVPLPKKRALPPNEEPMGNNKKVCTARAPLASGPLPCCAVCLGRNLHRTIECVATHTWDKQHETFAERVYKGLWTKDGKQLCTA